MAILLERTSDGLAIALSAAAERSAKLTMANIRRNAESCEKVERSPSRASVSSLARLGIYTTMEKHLHLASQT